MIGNTASISAEDESKPYTERARVEEVCKLKLKGYTYLTSNLESKAMNDHIRGVLIEKSD
jgi:hypothetical protein